ncbi:hypothetical protein AVEN_116451-1 [Araneus ventricosus]|uniref:Uncharacterized protein n=1 Tax=Araneus ventricosus TaxID=182803 RepID=A0A4Y2KZW1_ARAVE|nr:hypothetical protein AVEN_116451-1 [Araneus ventricosus]
MCKYLVAISSVHASTDDCALSHGRKRNLALSTSKISNFEVWRLTSKYNNCGLKNRVEKVENRICTAACQQRFATPYEFGRLVFCGCFHQPNGSIRDPPVSIDLLSHVNSADSSSVAVSTDLKPSLWKQPHLFVPPCVKEWLNPWGPYHHRFTTPCEFGRLVFCGCFQRP